MSTSPTPEMRAVILTNLAYLITQGDEDQGLFLDTPNRDLFNVSVDMEMVAERFYRGNPRAFHEQMLVVVRNAFDEDDDPVAAVVAWLEAELKGSS